MLEGSDRERATQDDTTRTSKGHLLEVLMRTALVLAKTSCSFERAEGLNRIDFVAVRERLESAGNG